MNKETAEALVGFIARFKNEQPLYELSQEITLMPYDYKEAISDFVYFCYQEGLITPDCYTIIDELKMNMKTDTWFADLSEQQVLQCIGVIIRQDRFVDGLINQSIEDNTMIRLLTRIKVLYAL